MESKLDQTLGMVRVKGILTQGPPQYPSVFDGPNTRGGRTGEPRRASAPVL